jgi:uncharacterized protein YdaU (DUF1376 family)
VNYYKRHIGDYAKKAGHLSVLEHGVYTLLLDAYYDREQPPTRAEAVRIARCRSDVELAALDAVLADFFHEVDGRYVQDRVEEEFAKAEEQARINQANGLKGGRPRKPKGNPKETHSVSSGNPTESEKNPNPLIHQSTNPEKQKIGSPTGSRLPAEWVLPRSWGEWAEQERPDLDVRREAASFADYWHGVAGAKARKADWQATWRNWIRKADGMRRRAEQQAQPSARMGKLTKLEEMKNGLGNSGNHHGNATPDLLGPRQGACLRLGGGNGNGVGGGG